MRVEHLAEGVTRPTVIYALCDYPGFIPRYVGKTIRMPRLRHEAHVRAAKAGGKLPVHYWLRKVVQRPQPLALKWLEVVPAGEDWAARERYWIARLRADGCALLNLTDGGEGLTGMVRSQEHRDRIAAGLRTGATLNCEICATPFWRKRNEINRGDARFCSRRCYATSNRGKARPLPPLAIERGVAAAAAARRAQAHCKHGHAYLPDNVFVNHRGARVCLACRRASKQRARATGRSA